MDQDTLTVPAGGSATLTVTIDGSAAAAEFDDYHGVIIASTEAGDSLRTPIGVTISPPLSKLTIRLVKPAPVSELDWLVYEFGWAAERVDDLELPWYELSTIWRDTDDPQVAEGT